MLTVDSERGSFEVKYNFYTLYIYEQEFGTDLIKDLYGDGNMDVSADGVTFNFAAINWTATVKALWAGAKTANQNLPRFKEWSAEWSGGIDLFESAGLVIEEINKELFRFGVAPVS